MRTNALRPAYTADRGRTLAQASSIRISWLYFSTRSPRHGAPVFRWPVPSATVRSAMKLSTVSPLRCDTMAPQFAS
jgi:hypothetical protein